MLGLVDPYESKLRALYRLVCLLLLPGLSDHFPVRSAPAKCRSGLLAHALPLLPGLSVPFLVRVRL